MEKIKYLTIEPKTKGFGMSTQLFDGSANTYAYTNLDDLLLCLGELLNPGKEDDSPTVHYKDGTMFFRENGVETILQPPEIMQRMKAVNKRLDAEREALGNDDGVDVVDLREPNDGWRAWNGSDGYPVGLQDETIVEFKLRGGSGVKNTRMVQSLDWSNSGGPYDIVAYRVVNP